MRLFIAIKFSRTIEQQLVQVQNDFRRLNVTGHYTDVKNLHLTLAFIGEYDRPKTVMDALKSVDFTPFELTLKDGVGHFGNLYWAGMEKSPQLMSLSTSVRQALEEYRIPFDRKPFNPHITLLRKAVFAPQQEQALQQIAVEPIKMTASKISLMHSHYVNRQTVYTEIGSAAAKPHEAGGTEA